MNMEMNLSITNKLVENLFLENKCFFYMSSCTQLRLKCEKFQFLIGGANVLRVSRGILEAATRCVLLKKVFLDISQNSQENTCAKVSFLMKLQAPFHRTRLGDCFLILRHLMQRHNIYVSMNISVNQPIQISDILRIKNKKSALDFLTLL